MKDDPANDPDYQAFIASMEKFCRCDYDRPCDGVLAGGLCDETREEMDDECHELWRRYLRMCSMKQNQMFTTEDK